METKELIQIGLENVKRALDRALDGLTPVELKWQPRPDANSIGIILFDITRSEDASIQSRLQGKPQLWESEKWYQKLNKAANDTGGHYTAEQVAAFVVPDLKDMLGYAEAVHKRTLEYLKDLTPGEFDKKVVLPPMGPPPTAMPAGSPNQPRIPPFRDMTVGSMLMMNVTHFAQHAGEISYLRGLLRGMNK
jgi:DinB superfamily